MKLQSLLDHIILGILTLAVTVDSGHEGEDFCESKVHYNGQGVTCCNNKMYPAPAINPFLKDAEVDACLENDNIKSAKKLSTKSWLLYRCLIEKKITGDLTLDSFTNFMVQRFENDVQTKIKERINIVKQSLPKEFNRKKRSYRVKREDTETTSEGSSTASEPTSEGSSTASEATSEGSSTASEATSEGSSTASEPTSEGSSTASEPTSEGSSTASEPTSEGSSTASEPTSEGSSTASEPTASTSGTTEVETISTSEASKDNSADANDSNETTSPREVITESGPESSVTVKTTLPPKNYSVMSTYDYLSVFDYFETFKSVIPDEFMLRIWDAYYTAEFEACQKLANANDTTIKSYGTDRCYSWIQRTARAGECCGVAPIPFPLLNDPPFDLETVQNFTAENILSIPGTYTWTNYTYSSNIMRCRRLATAIMLNQASLEKLKEDTEYFITMNATTPPDYKAIARQLVPYFYPEDMRNKLVDEILPEQDPEDTNDPNQYFRVMSKNSDLEIIANLINSEYIFAAPHEWENLDTNRTRYVMWTCDAYRMVSQRIKYFDTTPFCYDT